MQEENELRVRKGFGGKWCAALLMLCVAMWTAEAFSLGVVIKGNSNQETTHSSRFLFLGCSASWFVNSAAVGLTLMPGNLNS
jgi:hypothetical protein